MNNAGQMIESEWLKLPKRFKNIQLHEYIVMPNHFHAILEIVGETAGATLVIAQNDTKIENDDHNPEKGNHNGLPQRQRGKRWGPWLERFNPLQQLNTSVALEITIGNHLAGNYGNAIIGNTSFAMKNRI